MDPHPHLVTVPRHRLVTSGVDLLVNPRSTSSTVSEEEDDVLLLLLDLLSFISCVSPLLLTRCDKDGGNVRVSRMTLSSRRCTWSGPRVEGFILVVPSFSKTSVVPQT